MKVAALELSLDDSSAPHKATYTGKINQFHQIAMQVRNLGHGWSFYQGLGICRVMDTASGW